MGPRSYMWSVIHWNIIMRRIRPLSHGDSWMWFR